MIRAFAEKAAYKLLLFSLPELKRRLDELVAESGHTRQF